MMLDEESDESCDDHHDAVRGAARLAGVRTKGLGALGSPGDRDGGAGATSAGVRDRVVVGRGAGQGDCGGAGGARDGRA